MAYTTCTFWIKVFMFWFVLAGIGSLMTILICPGGFMSDGCPFISYVIAGFICSPILFANQIYHNIKEKQTAGKQASYEMNKTWLKKNYSVIRKQYINQFIAIFDLQIIDSDKNLNLLKERIKFKSLNPKSVYFQFISTKEEKDSYDKIGRKV